MLGLGKKTTLQVTQTSYYVIRLGVTTVTFTTPGGPVKYKLPEFNGEYFSGICSPCEIADVGQFRIPSDATSGQISGTFGNSTVPNTAAVNLNLLQSGLSISLARQSLTQIEAVGAPTGGTFSYLASLDKGSLVSSIALASGVQPTDNPNTTTLTAPASTGAPTAAGLTKFEATYALKSASRTDKFLAPAFGMSCYMIALQSDYGTPPKNCTTELYKGKKYSGYKHNPLGLVGDYCTTFILNVEVQGAAELNDGTLVQYDVGNHTINTVTQIVGKDGTALVTGGSVARDRKIIPQKNTLIDLDTIGNGIVANDTGGDIKGYRLDLFNGAGVQACASYTNPIIIGACETPQANCPGSVVQ